MTAQSLTSTARADTFTPFALAVRAWVGMMTLMFLLEVLLRAVRSSATAVPPAEWSDGLLVAAVVLVSSWVYLRREDLSPLMLLAIGLLWALLSVAMDGMYRAFAVNHFAIRWLLTLLLGDYRGTDAWLWRTFLAVQVLGPLSIDTLKKNMIARGNNGRGLRVR
jgi:hypothetical protein